MELMQNLTVQVLLTGSIKTSRKTRVDGVDMVIWSNFLHGVFKIYHVKQFASREQFKTEHILSSFSINMRHNV